MVGAGRGLFHGACVASPGLPPRVERRRLRRDPLLFPPTPCLGAAAPWPAARSPPAAAAAWPRWGSEQRTAAALLRGQGWRTAARPGQGAGMGARATTWQGSRTRRRNVICASLFGVGAPEALVIGVVALLVFGPKGLAEVARNLGKTLRAFQPTIREIQDVSREFRSTLEREIGIDEISQSTNYRPTTMNNNQQPAADPNVKPEPVPYTSEELMKVTEEQIAASAAAAWNPEQPAASQQQEAATDASSEKAAISGGSDSPAAPAPAPSAPALAVSNSDPNQVNQSEKAETER